MKFNKEKHKFMIAIKAEGEMLGIAGYETVEALQKGYNELKDWSFYFGSSGSYGHLSEPYPIEIVGDSLNYRIVRSLFRGKFLPPQF
jgi:hypothetical protein